jgi:hypothetical protein
VIAEKTLSQYASEYIKIPIGTPYSVELAPNGPFGLISDTYTGTALVPEGYGSSYTQQVSLYYLGGDPPYVSIYYYIPYVSQLPPLSFTIRRQADDTVIYQDTIYPNPGENSKSKVYIMAAGLMAYVDFEEMENYIVGDDQTFVIDSTSQVRYLYPAYYFVRIQNSNTVDVPYTIVDAGTEEVLYEGVILSSYMGEYMPIRPGRQYRIDYGAVAGYVTPASETATAGNNAIVTKNPVYVAV